MAKVPVNLKILLLLWRSDSRQLRSAGVASLAALYHSLTFFLIKRYREASPEFADVEADRLLVDLETVALGMLCDGIAHISEARVASTLGHFPTAYLESGLLQRNGTLVHFPHLTFQEYFAGRALAR